MNDAVDRLIRERAAMDRGFPGSVLVSIVAHLMLVGFAFAAPLLFPGEPPLRVQDGFAIALPPGGGGTPNAEPPAPAPVQPQPAPSDAPPKVLKPPKEEPKRGLPEPDAKKAKGKKPPKKEPRPVKGGVPGGAGNSIKPQGLDLVAPPGPGVPGGTDPFGDWYLAGVQQKIWMIWTQQIKSGWTQPIIVKFTILADGSVADVDTLQSSGVTLLDLAAKRAVYSAAPFGPLPKDYGTNRITIQAIFKPIS